MRDDAIDWEAMMTTTQRDAGKAALHAERTLGGVAQVIETQRQHGSHLAKIAKAIEEVREAQRCPSSPPAPQPELQQSASHPSARVYLRGWTAAFVLGAGFAAFFTS